MNFETIGIRQSNNDMAIGAYKIWKDKYTTITKKLRIVNAFVFPVVLFGCESWTIRKSERRRIDRFELWCWRRLLRIPWTARRTNKSVIEEIKAQTHYNLLYKAAGYLCLSVCLSLCTPLFRHDRRTATKFGTHTYSGRYGTHSQLKHN